jgi:hypothetical protein
MNLILTKIISFNTQLLHHNFYEIFMILNNDISNKFNIKFYYIQKKIK